MRLTEDNSNHPLRRLLVALGQKRTARRIYFAYAVLIGLLLLAQPLRIRIPLPILAPYLLVVALTALAVYVGVAAELIHTMRENPWPRFQLSGTILIAGGLLFDFGIIVGSLVAAAPVLRNSVIIAVMVACLAIGAGLVALITIPLLVVSIVGLFVWVPIMSIRMYMRMRARRRYRNPMSRTSRAR